MQPTWISRAATLLDDPIMMEWAVHYYHDLSPRSELKGQLENLWFNDVTIKRWIDAGDQEILGPMFLYLPEQRFSMFAATIAGHWSAWPSTLANSATKVLVCVAPELAAETFGRYLESARPVSLENAVSIMSSLDQLPPEAALAMLEKLLPLAWGENEMFVSLIRHDAFRAAVALMPQALPRLLDGLYAESEHRLNGVVEFMADCLFGHDTYADLYFLRRDDYDVASFADLSPLFDGDAPLAEMDEVMRSETPLPIALHLLETHHRRSPESSLAWETIRQSEVFRDKKHPLELAALALAGVAAAFERKTIDAARLSIDDVIALLALDVKTNIHYAALLEKLRSFPQAEIATALTSQLEKVANAYGGVTLARLMGDFGWAEFTQPLIACIGESNGDYLMEAAREALLNIGAPARDALIAQWDNLDLSQRIYGGSVIAGVGGDAPADFAFSRFDELIHKDIELCCDLLQAAPDIRLIEKLRFELRRKQPLIDKTYYRLCLLLDKEGKDLPEVHERIVQGRKRQQKAMENFRKGDFNSDRKTLYMSLRCTVCGEVNNYEVKGVVTDASGEGEKSAAHLIADEFPCLSCGKLVDFEFGPMAHMALLAETIRVLAAREAGEEAVTPLVSTALVKDSQGNVQPLVRAYADLREIIRNNPNDSLSLFRLGNISLGLNRPQAALGYFRRAHASNPLSLDALINLAGQLIKAGEKREAFDLLSHNLQNHDRWQTLASHPAEKGWEFAQLFNQLRRDLGRSDLPALHPNFLGSVPKVGRNDPCPAAAVENSKNVAAHRQRCIEI